jgi:aryl-alcohol dehydrogenase-like predicted oxidoreductase
MEQRRFGRWQREVGVIGLGCWQLGADWGAVSEDDAMAVLHAAVDGGVTLLDTADVYGDGRSEQLVGRVLRQRADAGLTVVTKMGRRANPHVPESFTPAAMRSWLDRSRSNLGVDRVDLVQLHCPPTPVLSDDRVFDTLDGFVAEGILGAYGVSVETCAEALTSIARPGVKSVQIILNPLRLKPLDEVVPAAAAAGVGIIARVPLASGLLSGRYDSHTVFGADDHRNYNRHGEAFDVGETFSGVDYETGLRVVAELNAARPEGWSMAATTLRWIAEQPGVTAVIPGARSAEQARANAEVGERGALPPEFDDAVRAAYDRHLRADIHPRW